MDPRDHETRFAMTSKSWVSRLGAPLFALVLTVAPSVSTAYAVEDARKVSVVSFGLFGGRGIASILALKRAPAYAQATTLHWLRWKEVAKIHA
jgi:hypothetical protein